MSFLVLQKNSTDIMVFFFKSNRNKLFCQIKDQITSSFSGFLGCFRSSSRRDRRLEIYVRVLN